MDDLVDDSTEEVEYFVIWYKSLSFNNLFIDKLYQILSHQLVKYCIKRLSRCQSCTIIKPIYVMLYFMQASEDRLKSLSGFQSAVLSHSLTFPKVKKVIYSTCSVHKQVAILNYEFLIF